MYPVGHPYHHTTIGSMNDLNAAKLEDVKQWIRTWYGPNNAVLVLAGNIDVKTATKKAARYLGHIATSTSMTEPRVTNSSLPHSGRTVPAVPLPPANVPRAHTSDGAGK